MSLIKANPETCMQDGSCSAVCPMNLIDYTTGGLPTAVAEVDGLCIRCGHCVAVCSTGSLIHAEIPFDRCPPVRKNLRLTAEQSEQFFKSRRSIRNFRANPVSRETLQQLIETARYAPTGHNTQGVSWLVLRSRIELSVLTRLVGDWLRWMIENKPIEAMSVHLDAALERLETGKDIILRGAPVLIIAHGRKDDPMVQTSSTIALSHLELAATSFDLGACWAGYFNAAASHYPPLQEALTLPAGHVCLGSMLLGYPQYQYHHIPERKAPLITWR